MTRAIPRRAAPVDVRLASSGLPELSGRSSDDFDAIWRQFRDLLSVTFDALREEDPTIDGDVVAQIVAENMGLRWKPVGHRAGVTVYLAAPPRPSWWRRGWLRYAGFHPMHGVSVDPTYGRPEQSRLGVHGRDGKVLMPHTYTWM